MSVNTVWLAAIILGRDLGLGIAALRYRWLSLPPPKTFSRYWDFSLPSAEVRPTSISKYNTFLQLTLIAVTISQPFIECSMGLDINSFLRYLQYVHFLYYFIPDSDSRYKNDSFNI